MSSPWRVIIVGGGFGGLSAVQALRSELVSRSQCLRVPPLRSSRLDRLGFDTPHVHRDIPESLFGFHQWAIQDLTLDRGARLITGAAPTDLSFNEEVAGGQSATH